jgi:hypothetical protein
MAAPATMTKESVRALIDGVENDPLAGLGCFSKKDLLVDRILAHSRLAQPVAQSAAPRPVLTEPSTTD